MLVSKHILKTNELVIKITNKDVLKSYIGVSKNTLNFN